MEDFLGEEEESRFEANFQTSKKINTFNDKELMITVNSSFFKDNKIKK